tara:strand:- start:5141 stop:5425 length:285 start_codon:yes stop_codon:yes gene_type:complete
MERTVAVTTMMTIKTDIAINRKLLFINLRFVVLKAKVLFGGRLVRLVHVCYCLTDLSQNRKQNNYDKTQSEHYSPWFVNLLNSNVINMGLQEST